MKKNVLYLFQETVCFVILNKTKQKHFSPQPSFKARGGNYTVLAHLYIKIKLKFGFHPNLIGFKIF